MQASGEGQVAVVTGASSGIGKQVAKVLAKAGWRVIGTGRAPERIAEASREIGADASDGGTIDMIAANLSLMSDVEQLAAAIAAKTDRIDVLFNNAGQMTDRLAMTAEGLEANFAGNHLGPFLLTQRLMPLLQATSAQRPAGAVRILMTSSDASEMLPGINLDDIQHFANFSPGLAYCAGKLANVLFAKGLASRLSGSGIVAHAMAPGATDTAFFSHASAEAQARLRDIAKLSPAEGADTLIWLATADEPGQSSGGYWEKRAPRQPHPQANDPAVVERFWLESEKLIGSVTEKR